MILYAEQTRILSSKLADAHAATRMVYQAWIVAMAEAIHDDRPDLTDAITALAGDSGAIRGLSEDHCWHDFFSAVLEFGALNVLIATREVQAAFDCGDLQDRAVKRAACDVLAAMTAGALG